MARPARFAASLAIGTGLGLLVTACGGGNVVDATKLEQSIRSTLDKDPLTTVRSVSCPDDIASVAGKRFTCAVESPSGAPGIVSVTVRDSQRHVRWSLTQPPAPGSGALARVIQADFVAHDPRDAVSRTTCPSAVLASAGSRSTCTIALTSGLHVLVTVTRESGGGISWSYAAAR